LALGPAVLNRDVLALDIAGFAQPLAKCRQEEPISPWRCAIKEADHGFCRLLRARSERPRCRRAAEKAIEIAPPHCIELHPISSQVWHSRISNQQ
jgi:hypothetical protein